MRPLMAAHLSSTATGPTLGAYDEARAVTLGFDGVPLVETRDTETFTKVRDEPTDAYHPSATETFTRTGGEENDEDAVRLDGRRLPAADDAATGVIGF
jgi:hypothetical protein